MAPIETLEPAKAKKEKKDKSAKKRAREEEAQADGERKHKKSKSVADASVNVEEVKKEKKKKKKKQMQEEADATQDALASSAVAEEPPKKSKKSKLKSEEQKPDEETPSKKDKKKKSKKSKEEDVNQDATKDAPEDVPQADAMEIDTETPSKPSSKIHAPSDIPADPQFPFFTQTISLFEPLFPSGWAEPISGCESQHLRHLKDRYVPSMRGVLLDYHNISLGQNPGRSGAATSNEDYATLSTKGEFGGGFGWMTADVKLFVPTRGAWMEGSVNLQTEGHIGVVCFGKFNASIEAVRLPKSWKWVPNESDDFEESASVFTGAEEHGVVRQLHSTGYWVDADGEKIKGRVRFRIRNFDVGVSGPSTFLSLQGTMLNKQDEKALVSAEAKEAQERKQRKGGKWRARRTLPDFSMTKFETAVEEEETNAPEVLDTSQVQTTEE